MLLLRHSSFVIGLLGALVIVVGILIGLVRFIRSELAALRGGSVEASRHELRRSLGYYLLLGLEFLIAADIIDTLMRPELQELAALAVIVAIRTVISWSLNAELRERVPKRDA